jgi:hypothetical protein
MSQRARALVVRRHFVYLLFLTAAAAIPRTAAAEKILAKGEDWEVFTDGRAAGFASWAYGDGLPAAVYVNNFHCADPNDPACAAVPLQNVSGGGFTASHEQGLMSDPSLHFPPPQNPSNAGTINMWRIRSGFIANILGFGARTKLTPWTTMTAYVQLWAFVESEGRQKNVPNFVDARQGYAKLEGPWGAFLAGRTRALFNRGATDIDALYAHRWGLGFPGANAIDSKGPAVGQIGFGVHGSGFAPGFVYTTPNLLGFKLDIGAFDPIQLPGRGWTRTKYLRPEAELTYELRFGGSGKLVVFGNGAYQKVYKDGYCPPPTGDVLTRQPCEETAYGVGYGLRFELGPVHIGLAGDYGKGTGLNYALESSDAAQDQQGNLRIFDSYYAQLQIVLGKFDLFTGAGIERVFLTDFDKQFKVADPRDPLSGDPATQAMAAQIYSFSYIKDQFGVNAGIVFNATPNLHFDIDFFRAQADWWAVNNIPAAKQVLWISNGGMTVNW